MIQHLELERIRSFEQDDGHINQEKSSHCRNSRVRKIALHYLHVREERLKARFNLF